jgi:DNA-binding PadR family transcriptional regulator
LLRQIGEKPSHGYDILRTIEEKTNGSWRPGAGSIYPILKELVSERLIKAGNVPISATSQRVYEITPVGKEFLNKSGDTLLKAGRNWEAMRSIWVELADPKDVGSIFPHMSTGQMEFVRQLVDAKKNKMRKNEVRRMLKEYLINLERQIDWTKSRLKQLSF